MVTSFYPQQVATGKEKKKGHLLGSCYISHWLCPPIDKCYDPHFTVSLLRLHNEVSPQGTQGSYSQCQDLTTGHLRHPQPRPTTTRHMNEHWATVRQGFLPLLRDCCVPQQRITQFTVKAPMRRVWGKQQEGWPVVELQWALKPTCTCPCALLCSWHYFYKKQYLLFIWLCWVLGVASRIFSYHMWDLVPLTRDWTQASCLGSKES